MCVSQVRIMYPVLVQVLLATRVYGMLSVARACAVRNMDRQRGSPDLAIGTISWPDDVARRANYQRNQFALPVLFYPVVAFALILNAADLVMIVLARAFVLVRRAHAAVDVGPNKARWRSPAFALALLIATLMWVKLLLNVVPAGLA
jgi:hypothetical protein